MRGNAPGLSRGWRRDDYKKVVRALVDDHVVHRTAIVVTNRAVAGLAFLLTRDVAGNEPLHGLFGRPGRGRRPHPCARRRRGRRSRARLCARLLCPRTGRASRSRRSSRASLPRLCARRRVGCGAVLRKPSLPLRFELSGGAGFVEAFGRGAGRGCFEFFGRSLGQLQHRAR